MTCSGCGNDKAFQTHGYVAAQGCYVECCDRCSKLSPSQAALADVFWNGRPYYSEALGVEFTSREQKARVMKERDVSELGSQKLGEKSWIEGSREYRRKQFDEERPRLREIHREWKERASNVR